LRFAARRCRSSLRSLRVHCARCATDAWGGGELSGVGFGRAQPANGRCVPLQPTISLHRTPLSHILARKFLLRGGNARNPKLLWSKGLHVLAVSAVSVSSQ